MSKNYYSQLQTVAAISRLTRLQQVISSGEIALGTVMSLYDPTVAEIAGFSGLDFIWIDGEHGVFSMESIKQAIVFAAAGDCAALVRVRSNDAALLKPVLDMNPAGVIIPMVKNADEAAAAVAACRYYPAGIRGCGVKRASGYNTIAFGDYMQQSKNAPWVILQIEHIDAVPELDRILAVPGINSICVGPCDLALSMGMAEASDSPEVNKVIDEICSKVKRAGIVLGTASGNLPRWRKRGVDWFAGVGDCGLLSAGFRNFVKNNRQHTGTLDNCNERNLEENV